MKTYKNILVALDLTDLDTSLIQFTKFFHQTYNVDKIYFVHNIKKHEIDEIIEGDEKLYTEIEESIQNALYQRIGKVFKDSNTYEVLISNDFYSESLIAYVAQKYQIDLTIVGNKHQSHGSGIMVSKLLQLLNSDLLMVPENFSKFENILIATDFSKNSLKAFKKANYLNSNEKSNLDAIHIYHIPPRYMPYLSNEKDTLSLQKHYEKKAIDFKRKNKIENLNTFYVKNANALSVTKKIIEFTEKQNYQLLILTCKGKNSITNLLVGSVTNKLVNKHLNAPLLVVK